MLVRSNCRLRGKSVYQAIPHQVTSFIDRLVHKVYSHRMSRPREFDLREVRERLKDVFTAHGYNGTSLSMLMSASGLGKQSLYNAFGDKRALYLQTIEFIVEQTSGFMLSRMRAAPNGLEAVRFLVESIVDASLHPDRSVHTCLMSAGLLEGIEDHAVAGKLRELWTFSEQMICASVKRGQADLSIRNDMPADDLSAYLMTLLSGLRVTARACRNEAQVRRVADIGMKYLAL
jgi:TetR/AcrR family transcriptional repressor of nem operon